ncbi:uncharacterized protein LOC114350773 [Ostrinia furnacalis]|uniref:uncharacterized protein LOC114350773 n=1 Tax=Ostrinia furnacalis TaxID=93504 RepID=UPI001039427E|nr:uncharacterized protein LOC114350773 [Ostrinia furnacalis]
MDNLSTNIALVRSIKGYPCLYDNTIPAYTKKEITDKAWIEVSNETGISAGECKEKWKNLRWGFIRSLRPNPDGTVKKRYYLHDDMDFVLPFVKLLQKHGHNIPTHDSDIEDENIESAENEGIEYEVFDEHRARARLYDSKQTTEKNAQRKNGQSPQFFEYRVQEPQSKRAKIYESVPNHTEEIDYRKMFLFSLLPEINVLSESQMRDFRRKVFMLIDEIKQIT